MNSRMVSDVTTPLPEGIDAGQLEACIARRSLFPGFPPDIERSFEADRGPRRCRVLFQTTLVGAIVYDALLLLLHRIFADVTPLVLKVFLGINLPLELMVLLGLLLRPPAILRELGVVLLLMMAVISICYIAAHGASPERWVVSQLWLVGFLYVATLQRLRFVYTVLACALMYPCNLYLMMHLPKYTTPVYQASSFVFLVTAGFVLFSAYNSEWQQRLSYLLSLKARLQAQELDRLSKFDPLTGLGNRLRLSEALQALRLHPAEPFAVLLLDVDHFKNLNDSSGHAAGDQCLVRVAGIIQGELRGALDRAFRYGGEEFLVLLQTTQLAEAVRVAERIRAALEAAGMRNPGVGSESRVTVSVGVALGAPDAGLDAEKVVATADAALYAAKHAGRNRVFSAERGADGELVCVAAT